MRPKIYVETSIVSYLTARPSRDLITAGHQLITQQWWQTQRARFALFSAPPVIQEAQVGDPEAAARRLAVLRDIPLLTLSVEALRFAQALMVPGLLPAKAKMCAVLTAMSRRLSVPPRNCGRLHHDVARSDCRRSSGYP